MENFNINNQLSALHRQFPPTDRRPVIGITGNYGEQTCKLGEGYYKQVARAGGTPVIIPPLTDEAAIIETLEHIDALLLSGGADINPLFMGEEPLPRLGGINAERDLPELLITRLAFNRQLPILGICRGAQTLAVALGGKVAQDLSVAVTSAPVASAVPSSPVAPSAPLAPASPVAPSAPVAQPLPSLIKHSQDADRSTPTHSVALAEDSLLRKIFGREKLFVNSFHHQAVMADASVGAGPVPARSLVGPHLRVTATAPDGIVEAVESTEHKPILAVQWHPECMGDAGLPLFRWLVDEAETFRRVREVHSHVLTLDTHCDTPMLFPEGFDFATRYETGADSVGTRNVAPRTVPLVDLHRMTEGRLDASIMVAYLPQKGWDEAYRPLTTESDKQDSCSTTFTQASPFLLHCITQASPIRDAERGMPSALQLLTPKGYADSIFDKIEQMVAANSRYLALARTPADLWANKRAGKKSIMLGIENGLALEGDLRNLDHFRQRGVVYITLCHNGDNDLCDSAKGEGRWAALQGDVRRSGGVGGGVSPFGTDVIRRMNELGIMVDLSHAHERSFYDALDISSVPIVCSHSSCRALCDHPRNLTDDQMRALAQKGGVCQITLYPGFLVSASSAGQSPSGCPSLPTEATILDAMAHLDHAIRVMGIDHVGLGTDFDGDGGVPGLADASELTNFTRQLLARRYSEADIQKIWGGNFLRVMAVVNSAL